MNLTLTIISGLCWTAVYILIIYRSIKDKTYGMPFWALAFNISWEFIFSFVFVSSKPEDLTELIVNRVWLSFDVFIIISYFIYGIKDWPHNVDKKLFLPYSILVLVASYLFVYVFAITFNGKNGMYIAFIQNMMMSWLFINMLNKRNGLAGQSLAIAVLKMLGTVAPTLQYGFNYPFVLFLGINCFVADCIYINMVWKYRMTFKKAKVMVEECKDCGEVVSPMGQ